MNMIIHIYINLFQSLKNNFPCWDFAYNIHLQSTSTQTFVCDPGDGDIVVRQGWHYLPDVLDPSTDITGHASWAWSIQALVTESGVSISIIIMEARLILIVILVGLVVGEEEIG